MVGSHSVELELFPPQATNPQAEDLTTSQTVEPRPCHQTESGVNDTTNDAVINVSELPPVDKVRLLPLPRALCFLISLIGHTSMGVLRLRIRSSFPPLWLE
jgi:hypothetical protein